MKYGKEYVEGQPAKSSPSFFSKKFKELKENINDEWAERKALRTKSRAAYKKEMNKQELEYQRKKARHQYSQKYKSYKREQSGGSMGPSALSDYLTGGQRKKKKRRGEFRIL